jgi:hypothetical protein
VEIGHVTGIVDKLGECFAVLLFFFMMGIFGNFRRCTLHSGASYTKVCLM